MSLEELRAFLSSKLSLPRWETAKRIPSGLAITTTKDRDTSTSVFSEKEIINLAEKIKNFRKRDFCWIKTSVKYFLKHAWLDIRLRIWRARHETEANKFNGAVLRNASFHNRARAAASCIPAGRASFFATERNIFPAGRENVGPLFWTASVEKRKVEKDVTNRRDRRKWIDRSFRLLPPFRPPRRRC